MLEINPKKNYYDNELQKEVKVGNPYCVSNERGITIVNAGFASLVSVIEDKAEESIKGNFDFEDLMKMKRDDLIKLATDLGIPFKLKKEDGKDITRREIAELIVGVPVEINKDSIVEDSIVEDSDNDNDNE